jgi:hypothetical protein
MPQDGQSISDLTQQLLLALLSVLVLLVPIFGQLIVMCIRDRAQVLERQLARNTALTQQIKTELTLHRAQRRQDDAAPTAAATIAENTAATATNTAAIENNALTTARNAATTEALRKHIEELTEPLADMDDFYGEKR